MKTILLFKDVEINQNAGGIARMNYSLKKALEKRGLRVLYMAIRCANESQTEECQYFLPEPCSLCSKENVLYLKYFIQKESIDVILNNCFSLDVIEFLAEVKKVSSTRVISWIHNNTVEYTSLFGYRKELFLKRYHLGFLFNILTADFAINLMRFYGRFKYNKCARKLYKISDKVITVCDGNAREFKFLLNIVDKQNKIITINNFISDRETSLNYTKEKLVVWCGAINFELKKTNWMLDIWKQVSIEHQDWILNILGDSNQLECMKHYATNNNVCNVVFQGRVDPAPFYERAAILCSTSITESFGLTIIEGMQKGAVPIAFASSPSIPEIIKNNGILIKPFDKKCFATELSKLMSLKKTLNNLSKKCIEASSQYEESNVVNDWIELFNNIHD